MSAGEHIAGPRRAASRRGGSGLDWGLRLVFGLLLAALALAAMVKGGVWFAGFIAAVTITGLYEWHRMVGGQDYTRYTVIGTLGLAAALVAPLLAPQLASDVPFLILGGTALLDLAVAAGAGAQPLWQAAGPLYLGIPGVALFDLRANSVHGLWLVLILFAAVWAADTGALVSGKLIGGPKLAPVLSPNKTWAGFVGGTALAALAVGLVVAVLGGNFLSGAAAGLVLALAGHAGDLFESWVKRRVGRKDSGNLIPGHGGVLDRIDSILFAVPVCAVLVYLFDAHSLLGFGAQP
ncbi:MAG: phosphatidate cytidylyltransferase [Alphaproteobacteria bacterium]|nr:phosphatidate cytidylyltransferase [Alphaproteobacteria bacterium]